jgi:hypothetical protein
VESGNHGVLGQCGEMTQCMHMWINEQKTNKQKKFIF